MSHRFLVLVAALAAACGASTQQQGPVAGLGGASAPADADDTTAAPPDATSPYDSDPDPDTFVDAHSGMRFPPKAHYFERAAAPVSAAGGATARYVWDEYLTDGDQPDLDPGPHQMPPVTAAVTIARRGEPHADAAARLAAIEAAIRGDHPAAQPLGTVTTWFESDRLRPAARTILVYPHDPAAHADTVVVTAVFVFEGGPWLVTYRVDMPIPRWAGDPQRQDEASAFHGHTLMLAWVSAGLVDALPWPGRRPAAPVDATGDD
jgi:hypothetical protein